MPLERVSSRTSLVDVLDRVLDKGIIIDAWMRLSLIGIELVTVQARVVVASIATYLDRVEDLSAAARSAPTATSRRLVQPAAAI